MLCRKEKDAERRAQEERIDTLARRREAKLASLGPEPAAGVAGAVQIRVRLPDSTNHQRRFLASDALQVRHAPLLAASLFGTFP